MKMKKFMAVLAAAAMLSAVPVTGCGSTIDPSKSAATLDGKEIQMGVANFMAQFQAAQTDFYFLSYYGEDMWNSDSGDGSTMTDSVKESVMDTLEEYYLMDAHAADYGVELTEEEKTAITQAASQFLADNTKQACEKMGATQETVEEMLRLYKIQAKMEEAIHKEIDTNVTDEECAQKTFSYVRFDKTSKPETDSDTQTDDGAEAQADTQTDDAETEIDNKPAAEAFLASAADDFEAAAKEGEYSVLKCSYGAGDLKEEDNTTSMNVEVLKAADKLKDGEMAKDLIEAENSYYIIRMDSTDDKEAAETKKESILNERKSEKYAEVLEAYKKDADWKINESEWKKVNFDELYTQKAEQTTTDDSTSTDDAGDGTGTDTSDDGADGAGTDAADDADGTGDTADGADAADDAGDTADNSTDAADDAGDTADSADGKNADNAGSDN